MFEILLTRKRINLLTGEYSEQARIYNATVKATAALAVIFLFCVLIVSTTALTTGLMKSATYRNAHALACPDTAEAERLHRLAAETRAQSQNAARFFTHENIDILFLGAIAFADSEGLNINALEIDNREQSVFVSGIADDAAAFTAFIDRLEAGGFFHEVNVAGLESGDGFLEFLIELKPGGV